jgi:hypothetical protein
MFPSRHAIQRFQERVAPVTSAEAARRIREAAAHARVRPTPRWWTPVSPSAGLLFLYPASLPGVCLLVREGVVVTVYERSQCLEWENAYPNGSGASRTTAYRRPGAGAGAQVWRAA